MLHKWGIEACPLVLALGLGGCGGREASSSTGDAGLGGRGGAGGSSSGVASSSGGGNPRGVGSGGGTFTGTGDDNGGVGSSGGNVVGDDASPGSSGSSSGGSLDGGFFTGAYAPAPPGLAGFVFVVDGVVQKPMACPSDNWEFAPFPTSNPGDAGFASAILINTGQAPMAYIAQSLWSGMGYVPGVLTGDPNQLAGVLQPGGQVNFTSVYVGGITAALGSSNPFSAPDAGKYVSDEGTIPWPAGVSGSEGAAQMNVAEIEVRPSCGLANVVW